jgi:hypothetical protein
MTVPEKNRPEKAAPCCRHEAESTGFGRRRLIIGGVSALAGGGAAWWLLRPAASLAGPEVTVWKSPLCGCCGGWIAYMQGRGYKVTVNNVEDLDRYRQMLGVPDSLLSCHTARVAGYLVEGHVPEPAVARLLRERPDIKGIALPGMPVGAPGMDGKPGTYEVLAFDKDGRSRLFLKTAG